MKSFLNLKAPAFFCLFLLVVTPTFTFCQPDFHGISKSLPVRKPVHPYLLFSANEKAEILTRIKEDRKSSELFEKIRLEGRRHMLATVKRNPPQREIHTRYIGYDYYRSYQSMNSHAALTLAFLYQMTGDESYAAKAFEYADALCALDSWVNSAHYFNVIYSRVWPYNVKDDQVVFSFDITASLYLQQMALVYDWLYPAMSKTQRDRIRGAMLEKGILLVRGNEEYHWWSTAYKSNWSGICYSGIGLASLALLHEDPQLIDVIGNSAENLWKMIDNIGIDGGWQEGRGYWAYALRNSLFFMDALKKLSNGRIDMFRHRGLYPEPVDFALFGLTAGFGDGDGDPVGHSYLINKLVKESGSTRAAWYRKQYILPQESLFDLIYPAPPVIPVMPESYSRHFRSIDWAVMRKDFTDDNITIACKAGMNDDPHHGHLDCGSFILTWKGEEFIGEITRERYDERYFDECRWEYPQASSKGHNVIQVNGEQQIVAKYKNQPWKSDVGGEITRFSTNQDHDYVIMDPSNAYPNKELKEWIRWIVLDKEYNFALVLDRVSCAKGAEIELLFQPGVNAIIEPDRVLLQGRAAEMEMITLCNQKYSYYNGRHASLPVMENARFQWIPYFSTQLTAGYEKNVIGSVFIPSVHDEMKTERPNFSLEEKGRLQIVTCTFEGKEIIYLFSDDKVERKHNQRREY